MSLRITAALILVIPSLTVCRADERFPGKDVWRRHTIDASSRGADGVRLADVEGDGRLDIATGWEEGGQIRICRQPPLKDVRRPWPGILVGSVASPEDAVFTDIDRNGTFDVVSCCEGKTRTVYLHRAPQDPSEYWQSARWTTEQIGVTARQQAWMFCLTEDSAVTIDAERAGQPALIVGSKGANASISRLIPDSSSADDWQLRRLCDAGWIMSLRHTDMDGDSDADVLFSDRKGPTRCVGWLERPEDVEQLWPRHVIGGADVENMFLDVGDLTGDRVDEIAVATRGGGIKVYQRSENSDHKWEEVTIPMPANCGTGKGVSMGDVDLDGQADLVVSCENSKSKHGVFWLSADSAVISPRWRFHPISGTEEGIKFDRIELLDLDADGDLDVITCEERDNLGVIWYENPAS